MSITNILLVIVVLVAAIGAIVYYIKKKERRKQMAIFTIADLHLSFNTNKPMNIFGTNGENYEEKIKKRGSRISGSFFSAKQAIINLKFIGYR